MLQHFSNEIVQKMLERILQKKYPRNMFAVCAFSRRFFLQKQSNGKKCPVCISLQGPFTNQRANEKLLCVHFPVGALFREESVF